jgi:L-ascorbate metabolism protein UlaG (beta-lactamase superfamily)
MRISVKGVATLVLAAAGAAAGAVFLAGRFFSAPRYDGPPSDHFDGRTFRSPRPIEHGAGAVLRWMLTRKQGPWPEWLDAEAGPAPPERVGDGALRVTFVNHATVLIQIDGTNILTDPIWSTRTSPVSWAGPRRRRPPGIRLADLPPLDAVVVSHNHYDHLDLPTLRHLAGRFAPKIVTGLGNDLLLRKSGIPGPVPLDWWESIEIRPGTRIHFVPAQHFSARGTADRNATLWGGFVIESASGAVYFAGDTGWGPHFAQIRERFPRLRLAILPIGAFLPEWFMAPVHIGPADAVRAHRELGAAASMVMHFGTFPLGDDGETEAPDRLREHLASEPEAIANAFWIPQFGEGRFFE